MVIERRKPYGEALLGAVKLNSWGLYKALQINRDGIYFTHFTYTTCNKEKKNLELKIRSSYREEFWG